MTAPRTAKDVVLDSFFYAPLGLLGELRTVVPQLAEKGRVQVANARMMGQFAVQMGQSEAAKRVGKVEAQVKEVLAGVGLAAPDFDLDGRLRLESDTARSARPEATASPEATPKLVAVADVADAPDVASLAIPDYDSLAASQVVSRLAGLRAAELRAVRDYEAATRGRKTILGKIAQLQAS